MGLLFSDVGDDQQAALMQNMSVGVTWQFRYMRLRWLVISIICFFAGGLAASVIDYFIFNSTEYKGLFDLLINRLTGG